MENEPDPTQQKISLIPPDLINGIRFRNTSLEKLPVDKAQINEMVIPLKQTSKTLWKLILTTSMDCGC
jgi:hypothetical protein